MNEYCTWREDEDGLWWTTCKEIHEFFDGTPTENSYKFCPYCGKEIVEFKCKGDEAETGPEEGVMEKTEMMRRYEEETGETLDMSILSGDATGSWYGFLDSIEAKATAYDRLMGGGKKTLKEIANFLGNPVAVDREGRLLWFPRKPEIGLTTWIWYDKYLPKNIFDYTGDWKDSLTIPDGWEER